MRTTLYEHLVEHYDGALVATRKNMQLLPEGASHTRWLPSIEHLLLAFDPDKLQEHIISEDQEADIQRNHFMEGFHRQEMVNLDFRRHIQDFFHSQGYRLLQTSGNFMYFRLEGESDYKDGLNVPELIVQTNIGKNYELETLVSGERA